MASTLKILGQAQSTGSNVIVYTAPLSTTCAISSIVVCNRLTSNLTFTLHAVKASRPPDNLSLLYKDNNIYANSSLEKTPGATLGAGDYIVLNAPVGITVSIFGIENT
jgi:hypothetical protein